MSIDPMIRKMFLKILSMLQKWLCKSPIQMCTLKLNQILRFDVEKTQLKVLDKFYERDFLKSQKVAHHL